MKETDILIVGAGPAGLSAGIAAAKHGAKVLVIDENRKPGGQLFKQIHKFFGSREHNAGVRGFRIGEKLLEETEALQVEVLLGYPVYGIFEDNLALYGSANGVQSVKAKKLILATGANENNLCIQGSTLPGVMTAGAAQTMVNLHHVQPGSRVVMVGSGNVGLIVSYQMLQAGIDVVAVVEAAPSIGGYGVHANKLRRAGVPFYLSHTINRIMGEDGVQQVELVELDHFKPVPGTEMILDADTVCMAVGLTPMVELARTSNTYECLRELIKNATRIIPGLKDLNIIRTMGGVRPHSPDSKPLIGFVQGVPGFFLAAGHEGDGICLSPVTGKLVSDLIVDGKTDVPAAAGFDPNRFNLF